MKRLAKFLLIGTLSLVLLLALAMWVIAKGVSPLVDGATLEAGNVVVATDRSTGPMRSAAYLFRLKDGSLGLIDSTMDPEATAIRAAIARLGKTTDDVRAILFTHSHDDHTAGARAFPNAELFLLEPAGSDTTGSRAGISALNQAQVALPGSRSAKAPARTISRYLFDGECLDLHGTLVEVFALPGHTYDSAAFLVNRVLFLGDSAAGQSNGKIGAAPPIVSVDRKLNRSSLLALADRLQGRRGDIDFLAFGHQGPLPGLDPLLAWAADHRQP